MVKKRSRLFVLLLLPFLGATFLAGFILYVVGDKKRVTINEVALTNNITTPPIPTHPKPRKKIERKK
jgi:hypothetical protein